MDVMNFYTDPAVIRSSVEKVKNAARDFRNQHQRVPVIMEVCGSHTMAFARSGIKTALKDDVNLIAGPGCPVCVTDQKAIDAMIGLAGKQDTILCTFGDMMRVPGSRRSLVDARTEGKDVRVVYSPVDSVTIAERNPEKEVVFLGIGFETTIPLLAMAVRKAERLNLKNYSVWMTTKLVEPVLRTLLDSGEAEVDGFLLPGHVSVVSGEKSYRFLTAEYGLPGVITGFEPVQLLSGTYKLVRMLREGKHAVVNDYRSVVGQSGNQIAQSLMTTYFTFSDEEWRGMGAIPASGLVLKEAYAAFDAKRRFNVTVPPQRKTACRCGEIIKGRIAPEDCALFGKGCTPVNPVGPCMVSTEGTCAAHYQYMREE
ncbi:hydrogenase formation protein HypD [Alteribacter lacisalsi]|jgi:hydrogenase expression/formation protein HypD|uniref:Hydrogenase formation protein HypD n=1 Tax=Alteribacter lacisalsi TaxID=2045244 RepID=A0A2W0HK78_9BACI|nr:hydrogenase formation protein HypD [Alteribacter lacisalsi]PYZ97482.1 hydrogenase formation protein HypD [Alteribacter lacisalsi]